MITYRYEPPAVGAERLHPLQSIEVRVIDAQNALDEAIELAKALLRERVWATGPSQPDLRGLLASLASVELAAGLLAEARAGWQPLLDTIAHPAQEVTR